MATVIRLKNADFSGQGLPNINPFVALHEAEFAFDFRYRPTRLKDITGNHTLVGYKNDINAGVIHQVDPSVITDVGGLGISPIDGFLAISDPVQPIPVDGSVKFTVLIVGGVHPTYEWASEDSAGSTANTAVTYDYGSRVNRAGITVEKPVYVSTFNSRVASSDPVLSVRSDKNTRAPAAVILSFDGHTFNLINLTSGVSETYTRSELINTYSGVKETTIGHSHTSSTIHGFPPVIYQTAKWNRVLTDEEIQRQYQTSKSNFPELGI